MQKCMWALVVSTVMVICGDLGQVGWQWGRQQENSILFRLAWSRWFYFIPCLSCIQIGNHESCLSAFKEFHSILVFSAQCGWKVAAVPLLTLDSGFPCLFTMTLGRQLSFPTLALCHLTISHPVIKHSFFFLTLYGAFICTLHFHRTGSFFSTCNELAPGEQQSTCIIVSLSGTHLKCSVPLKHPRPLATLIEIFSRYLYLPFLLVKGNFLHLVLFGPGMLMGIFQGFKRNFRLTLITCKFLTQPTTSHHSSRSFFAPHYILARNRHVLCTEELASALTHEGFGYLRYESCRFYRKHIFWDTMQVSPFEGSSQQGLGANAVFKWLLAPAADHARL